MRPRAPRLRSVEPRFVRPPAAALPEPRGTRLRVTLFGRRSTRRPDHPTRGELLVHFVGRVERAREDFAVACRRSGLAALKLPRRNKTKDPVYLRSHWTEFYDREAREIVAGLYRRDIEHFGFSFEGPATTAARSPGAGSRARRAYGSGFRYD